MKFLTLAFILTLGFSSYSFADYGIDNVTSDGAICEHRVAAEKKLEDQKKKELEESTVIIN